jgi:peptidyl-prolyl cis-trans isomerase C
MSARNWIIASRSVQACIGALILGCSPQKPGTVSSDKTPNASMVENVVGRYAGGVVTSNQLNREANRLPPVLREHFANPAGKRELVRSVVDKRLLVQEARRRGLPENPEIRQQVADLEERLIVQAMLVAEEKAAGPASETELRAFFDAHKMEFEQPERLRVARVLVAVSGNDSDSQRKKARARAEKIAERLRRGEPMSKVAGDGEGSEVDRGGELDFIIRGKSRDAALEEAAFALKTPGAISPVFLCREGWAVLQLIERTNARIPSFEEISSEVEGRVAPIRRRKVFDDLLAKLRRSGDVHITIAAP